MEDIVDFPADTEGRIEFIKNRIEINDEDFLYENLALCAVSYGLGISPEEINGFNELWELAFKKLEKGFNPKYYSALMVLTKFVYIEGEGNHESVQYEQKKECYLKILDSMLTQFDAIPFNSHGDMIEFLGQYEDGTTKKITYIEHLNMKIIEMNPEKEPVYLRNMVSMLKGMNYCDVTMPEVWSKLTDLLVLSASADTLGMSKVEVLDIMCVMADVG